MIFWLTIMILLALATFLEYILDFRIPLMEMRSALLFLVALGVSYRVYYTQRQGEREKLLNRIRELEALVGEKK